MKKEMTIKEFATLGGIAKWKGKTKKDKSIIMTKVSHSRKKEKCKCPICSYICIINNK